MVRGTLANIRLRNQLAPGTEGGWTRHLPDGEQMSIYDAAMKYQRPACRLVILAGKEYGPDRRATGLRRESAARRPRRHCESFERIHRTNLVGMGVLPLQFHDGENAASLCLTGAETFHVEGIPSALNGGGRKAKVRAVSDRWEAEDFYRDVRSIRPKRWSTTATAGFSRTCCGSWPA
jgi:aconitate hydratase